jgi:hypothetical protein
MPCVCSHREELRAAFLDHPKAQWIEHVPVFSQTQKYPVNIAGALHMAQRYSRS